MGVSGKAIRVVCGVAVINGKVLAARRDRKRSLGGLWEFPGGKVEPDETPGEALVREWQEELGLEPEILGHLSEVGSEAEETPIQLIPFRVALPPLFSPRPLEHEALCWIDLDDALELAWVPGDLPILEELQSKEKR